MIHGIAQTVDVDTVGRVLRARRADRLAAALDAQVSRTMRVYDDAAGAHGQLFITPTLGDDELVRSRFSRAQPASGDFDIAQRLLGAADCYPDAVLLVPREVKGSSKDNAADARVDTPNARLSSPERRAHIRRRVRARRPDAGDDGRQGCPRPWAFAEHIGSWLPCEPDSARDLMWAANARVSEQAFAVSIKIRVESNLRRTQQLVETGVPHISVHLGVEGHHVHLHIFASPTRMLPARLLLPHASSTNKPLPCVCFFLSFKRRAPKQIPSLAFVS
ncbi:hypothetical protein AURDEDRAFT_178007 [Auricularia subglabra TFB-10046 SS5]|uniref:Uncharacterized protein n=1 Tax=Auricularia subglabra (strain TFB-10046 / SS5) TaxID=717982 RepID=J0CRK8_AURST|nr:hypothetical protein AURDEDRAFT_178007 [Auricularia subglabra TFB-10046 SS5]